MSIASHRSLGPPWLPLTVVLALGCSGTSNTDDNADTGGTSSRAIGNTQTTAATGGASAMAGGSAATGGERTWMGGAVTQGGTGSTPTTGGPDSGGAATTGGTRTVVQSSGGSTTAGGQSSGGGSSAPIGGKSSTGGAPGAGGITTTIGGRTATAIATGGKSSAGGAIATGGKSSMGGASATGGMTGGGGTTGCDVSAPPATVAAWIEESWNAEGRNNMSWHKTWLHDAAVLGNGEINICVRYGATQSVTVATRDRIAPAMQRWFNKWFSKLYPYDCFPHPSVSVKVTGWAVKPGQESLLQWTDRTVPVYTEVSDGSDQAKGEPKCPDSCGFFFHPDHVFTGCPNGAVAHFDYTLWLNDKLPSGAAAEGSNWGVRIPIASFLKDLETDDFLVMLHEIGHGFGISDYYSWTGSTAVGGSVMMLGTANTVSIGDQWMARRYWKETKALRYR